MMDLGVHWGTHLPQGLDANQIPGDIREERVDGLIPLSSSETLRATLTLKRLFPTQAGLAHIAAFLRQAQADALSISIDERIATFDTLAQPWISPGAASSEPPPPSPLTLAIACASGFSPQMVQHALHLEQVSSQGPHLRRALRGELGDEYALDGFVPNPLGGGATMAIGPGLVGSITSANIPGLPHLEVMRALLVKGACLAKVPSGEPIFLAHYARALEALHPALGACLAVIALDRADAPLQAHFASLVDHLTVYGGVDAIKSWREAAGAMASTWHGHKVGVAALGRERTGDPGLGARLRGFAYDFSLFDQEACLSPAVLYVEEGGERSPREIAQALGSHLSDEAKKRPPRRLNIAQRAAQRRYVEGRIMGGAELIHAPKGWPYLVLLDPNPTFGPSAPGRVVRICAIPSLEALPSLLTPLGRYLQNAVIEAPAPRRRPLMQALARLGLSRVTHPGLMGAPSMMWHHDGIPCLSQMVRFCDEEVKAPGEWGREEAREN